MSSGDRIGELLKLAGRREMPDAAQMSRAHAAARAEWMSAVAYWRRPFRLWAIGGGAAFVFALVAAVWFRPDNADDALRRSVVPSDLATLDTVTGTVHLTRQGSASSVVTQSGLRVYSGDRLDTLPGSRAVLLLTGGATLKVDGNSAVRFDSNRQVTLDRGAVFLDMAAGATGRDVDVRTVLGLVRHLGTQFEVRLEDGALGVRVREGTVAVENTHGRWISHEGEALRVVAGRSPERRSILTYGGEWIWVDDLAPPFALEGATLAAFLEWAGRHHGLRWEYATTDLRDRVQGIVLHGSIEGLSAEEAFDAVLRTCGLSFRRYGTRLIISSQTER